MARAAPLSRALVAKGCKRLSEKFAPEWQAAQPALPVNSASPLGRLRKHLAPSGPCRPRSAAAADGYPEPGRTLFAGLRLRY